MPIFPNNIAQAADKVVTQADADRLFVLTDEHTHDLCLPLLSSVGSLNNAQHITIGATDIHKDIASLTHVWQQLVQGGATRHSLLLCLGGGMVTDLGGFAASTFKRGIRYVNIPTTLLAMVDAAVGGKTGINFCGLKNEVGVFSEAMEVIISTDFLRTLDAENLRSGYAEMLKHALLSSESLLSQHLGFDLAAPNLNRLQELVCLSVDIKSRIVESDPHERGLRKALNLGHTIGHAFESMAMEKGRPILHGYAVAYGLACELWLSTQLKGFPQSAMRQVATFVRNFYGRAAITCDDYEHLYELMSHDKKNVAGQINFALLSKVGKVELDCHASKDLIFESLDFMREGL